MQPWDLGPAQPRAMSRKVSDEFVVPLCRVHHRALHRGSDEAGWWRELGIDPLIEAERLWSGRSGGVDSPRPTVRRLTARPPGSIAGRSGEADEVGS